MTQFCKLFIFSVIVLLLTECKKGEDDPSVSLRTRTSRLSGEWRLLSGKASITAQGYNESYTFDGAGMKVNVTSYYPVVYTGKYMLGLKVYKDGTFFMNENFAGLVLEAEGTWNFNTGVGEHKKKENVIFSIDKVKKGYTYGSNLFNRFSVNFTYSIKELRNKRLVITSEGKFYSDAKGNYVTLSTEYIFQQ